MSGFEWAVDAEALKKYAKERMNRPSRWAISKYYQGFNFNKINRRPMYQEELNDLEIVYKSTLVRLQKEVEQCLPSLLHYMEEFLSLNQQNEAVREKLDALLAKTGRGSQEEDNGGDDD
jgi:hypothetical protein